MALAGWADCRPQAVILVESGGAHGESGDGEVWIKLMSKLRCGKTDEGEGVGGVHPSGREGRTSGVKGRHGEAVGGGVGERDVVVGSDRGVLSGPALASNSPASLARLERPLGRGAVGGAGGLAFGRAAGAPAEADMETQERVAWSSIQGPSARGAVDSRGASQAHAQRDTESWDSPQAAAPARVPIEEPSTAPTEGPGAPLCRCGFTSCSWTGSQSTATTALRVSLKYGGGGPWMA